MNLAYTLSGNQVRTNRVFNPGNLYPQDLNILQSIQSEQFSKLAGVSTQPGIVSFLNPNVSGGALSVTVSGSLFTVFAGSAIFHDGSSFELATDVSFSLDIPSGMDTSYVLVLERTPGSSDQRYNPATDRSESVEVAWQFGFKLMTVGDYLPASVLNQDLMLLAQVLVDASQTSFSVLSSTDTRLQRSWFTAFDAEHRGSLGSGVVSTNNPHGLSLEDLSSSVGLSYWRQQDITGAVSAVLSNGRYGDLVKLFVPAVDLMSAVSTTGEPSAFYYDLPGGAAHVLTVRDVTNEMGTAFNYTYERSSHRLVVFGIPTVGGIPTLSGLYVHGLVVHAGTVSVKNGASGVLSIEAPVEGEFIVTPNGVVQQLNQTELDLGPLGGVSDTILIKVDSTGNVYPDPYPLLQTNLQQLQTASQFDPLYMQKQSLVNYYLTNFVVTDNFVVELRVRGQLNGNAQEEIVRIVGPASTDATAYKLAIPAGTNLLAAAVDTVLSQKTIAPTGSKEWTSITSLDVLSATSDLPVNLGVAMTYTLGDTDSIPLAAVILTRKGTIQRLADIREQRVFFERQTGDILYENFHNPVNFDPLWTTYQGRGLSDGQWVSRPLKLKHGTYQVTLNLDAYERTKTTKYLQNWPKLPQYLQKTSGASLSSSAHIQFHPYTFGPSGYNDQFALETFTLRITALTTTSITIDCILDSNPSAPLTFTASFLAGATTVEQVQVASLGIWVNVALTNLAVGDAFSFSTATPDPSVGSTGDFYFVIHKSNAGPVIGRPYTVLGNAFHKVDGAWDLITPFPYWMQGTGDPNVLALLPGMGASAYYADITGGFDNATFWTYVNTGWIKVYDPATNQEDTLSLALIRNFGNAPEPAYVTIQESLMETGGSKKVYQFSAAADDWYTFKVIATAGTRVSGLWLSTSISEQSIQQYIDNRLSEISLLPGPPGATGRQGDPGTMGPQGVPGASGSSSAIAFSQAISSNIGANWNGGAGHVDFPLNDNSGRKFCIAWATGATQAFYANSSQPEQTIILPVTFTQLFSTQITTVILSPDAKYDDDIFYQIVGQSSPGGAISGLNQIVVIPQITYPNNFQMVARPHLVVYGLI